MSNQLTVIDNNVLATITKSEIDQQIATARAYPRSIDKFLKTARQLATMSPAIASECIYTLPRDGKKISGPSIRLAEIIQCCWGNSRAGARIIDEGREFVTAQGVFHDLESNVAVTYETKRRITDRKGNRYSPDMIATTSNAACAIALRNAIFKGIPKAFWASILGEVESTIKGTSKDFETRRKGALSSFSEMGFSAAEVCKLINVNGVPDITIDHMIDLHGILTALRDGETSKADLFTDAKPDKPTASPPSPSQAPSPPKAPAPVDVESEPVEVLDEHQTLVDELVDLISGMESAGDIADQVQQYKDGNPDTDELHSRFDEVARERVGAISG